MVEYKSAIFKFFFLQVQTYRHITMPTLVRAVVHIIWIMSIVMDMKLT